VEKENQLLLGPTAERPICNTPESIRLEGRSVSLQPLSVKHVAGLWEASRDAAASWTYLKYGPFETIQLFEEHVAKISNLAGQPFFAVIPSGAAQPLGWLSFCDIEPHNAALEIGSIWFSPELQRTRAATEAIFLLLNYAFNLGYERIAWRTNELNAASRLAADRLGFVYEGTWRHAQIFKDHRRSTAWYSMLSSDWAVNRLALIAWLSADNFENDGMQIKSLGQFRH
jgi:RimJ/RimL family protein N-acetyltransferase